MFWSVHWLWMDCASNFTFSACPISWTDYWVYLGRYPMVASLLCFILGWQSCYLKFLFSWVNFFFLFFPPLSSLRNLVFECIWPSAPLVSLGTFVHKIPSFYRFNEALDGVVLTYEPKFSSNLARILPGIHPYFGVKLEAKLLLFNPKPEMLLGSPATEFFLFVKVYCSSVTFQAFCSWSKC